MELQPDGAPDTDSRRAMVAMAVILGMMLLWGYFFRRPPPTPPAEQPVQPTTAAQPGTPTAPGTLTAPGSATPTTATKPGTAAHPTTATRPDTSVKPGTATAPATATPPTVEPAEAEPALRAIVKKGQRFTAEFTNQDGALARLVLLDYYRTPLDKDKALEALSQNPEADLTDYGFPLLGQAGSVLSLVLLDPYEAQTDKEEGEEKAETGPRAASTWFASRRFEIVDEDERSVTFRTTFLAGRLELTKTYRLPEPDAALQRHVEVEIQLRNLTKEPIELPGYTLRGGGGIAVDYGPKSWKEPQPSETDRKMAAQQMGGAVGSRAATGDINVARRSVKKLQSGDLVEDAGLVLWSASETRYFAVVLEPLRDDDGENWVRSGGARSLGEHNLTSDIQVAPTAIAAGDSVVHRYRLFGGPKTRELLADYGYTEVQKKGWLDFLVRLMSFLLRGAHALIPNYGVAILILTIIVRACLHPLSRHSQKSMHQMQKLQPHFKEIREKYKHDKKRQQEEMLKLQREQGFSPFGGCLPMLLQLPVFIGLFRCLRESIELRHAPFLFIKDLSSPDSIIPEFPFIGSLNILPLIACGIMFAQQKMMPKSTDPQQAQTQKMMGYMMPAMIGFIFYSFPSGLALYFIASTCIGLIEQRLIKRHLDKIGDAAPKDTTTAKSPTKPKKQKPEAGRRRKTF